MKEFDYYLIGEVALAHDGSLGQAHKYIDMASDLGLDAVKFQIHLAEYESSDDEPFRTNFSYQDDNRKSYWNRTSFDKSEWNKLRGYARSKLIDFIITPFSLEAVDLCKDLSVDYIKVGSGDVDYIQLLKKIQLTNIPYMISSGMSRTEDLINIFKLIDFKPFALFHCISSYPTTPDSWHLNRIQKFNKLINPNTKIGLSDHSGSILPTLISYFLGARIFEFHLSINKDYSFGPDHLCSLDSAQIIQLRDLLSQLKIMLQSKSSLNELLSELKDQKTLFSRSAYSNKNIKSKTLIKEDDITFKKPGNRGLSPISVFNLLNTRSIYAKRDILENEPIDDEDILIQ